MRNGDDGRADKAPPPPPSDDFDESSSKLAAELFESSDFPDTQAPSRPLSMHDEPTRAVTSAPSRAPSGFGGDEPTRIFEAPPGNLAEQLAKEDDDKPYEHVPEGATSVMQLDPEMLAMLRGHREDAARRAAEEQADAAAIAERAASTMEIEHSGNRVRPAPAELPEEHSTPRSQTPFTDDAFGMPSEGAGFDNEPTGVMAKPPAGMENTPSTTSAAFGLPDIDFSMPSNFGAPAATPAAPSARPTSELPAHLQLPNFPEFDLPKGGQADVRRRITDDASIEGNLGGSFGALDSGASPGAPSSQAGADGWAVAPAANAMTPPPTPRRMGNTPTGSTQPNKVLGDGLPVLPNIGLPSMNVAQPKKEPTLIGAERAEMLATEKKKSMTAPIVITVIVLAAAGTGVFMFKDVINERVFGSKQTVAVETPTDKARKLTAVGQAAYDAGRQLEDGGKAPEAQAKYKEAVESYKKALDQDAMFAKAQRSLGIAYAKLNQPDEAVQHYRIYLALAPTSDDAAEVKKIIADYDMKAAAKALEDKAKAEQEAKEAAEREKAEKQKKRRR